MTVHDLLAPRYNQLGALKAAILDVDGVLLASPHERAWREALNGLADAERFTTAMYQRAVAGKPRLMGARAALEALGVPDAGRQAAPYAERKQKRLEALIEAGSIAGFPDALRFVQALAALGWPMAVASSSRNANGMMQLIHLDSGQNLLDVFSANVCGRDLPRGKPDPAIFLLAAELHVEPTFCFVAEDAPAGIAAARAGKMAALGVARHSDAASLHMAGADVVVNSLDGIALDELAHHRLCRVAA
ncbi:HAD family hydrolase [Rhodopila globiformis]|uniref:HAD family hydrolase n=1 Tax=Rhodopila globiformis TaxID=1071 RepID=A0A2S6NFW3_RHOGL|nr:HAD-IA family hydrolase [Rhodopila globiformis]PPQ33487.1 HAD family hydrolase [Rhodopila globiformis]